MKTATLASVLALSLASACQQPPPPPPPAPPAPPKPAAKANAMPTPPGPQIPAPADVAAPSADAIKLPDGLAYRVITPGSAGDKPGLTDKVTVNYTGWTTDGKMFDSSVARGHPATFPVNGVIAGWTELLQLMVPGQKVLVWIPEELAYKGKPNRPQGMLVFEVELISSAKAPPPPVPKPAPPVPADVAKPPKDAKKTASGLEYKVQTKGTGDKHPSATSQVQVDYSGWTTDGKMFDSSVTRGQPATFPLNGVIKGWTEGVQLMTEGETTRFWIPEELAYKGVPGRPQGMLVFDVTLLKILSP